jgi:hypothetical protein
MRQWSDDYTVGCEIYGSAAGPGLFVGNTPGPGVLGDSFTGEGVRGQSTHSTGVVGNSLTANGVAGYANSGGIGIYGESVLGYAGYFSGDVGVSGTLSKAAGSFIIDHPLDPVNKTLSHSFVESPDMMNIYNGTTITDVHGDATITLSAYFQTLNREFRRASTDSPVAVATPLWSP